MKRFLAIILAGLMLISLVACGGKNDESVVRVGVLEMEGVGATGQKHDAENHPGRQQDEIENVYYNNLSTALLDLQNEKVMALLCEKTTADYIMARNENLEYKTWNTCNFSMMTMDTNKEVYDILNNAIKEMKADGTLDSLIANELKAYINSDPVAKDLPKFEGAKTIKIGVTGDVPPMDFVASNGKAAGFNIALLAEIANRAQVNIELVQIESGARTMALSSGKVDAIFWTKSVTCVEHNGTWEETVANTLVTESYFSDYSAVLTLKPTK